jgi:hypothetical protein
MPHMVQLPEILPGSNWQNFPGEGLTKGHVYFPVSGFLFRHEMTIPNGGKYIPSSGMMEIHMSPRQPFAMAVLPIGS